MEGEFIAMIKIILDLCLVVLSVSNIDESIYVYILVFLRSPRCFLFHRLVVFYQDLAV